MSSVQQVAVASVCLVAAFAFGSYINQSQDDQSIQQVDAGAPDGLQSLIQDEIQIPQVPTSTPWMKPKLAARLPPMPTLNSGNTSVQSGSEFNQQGPTSGKIPPPSDTRGRGKSTQSSFANSFPVTPTTSGIIADAPSFASELSGESSMPVINKQILGSSPNLADSMRAPLQTGDPDEPRPTVQDAPVFAVDEGPAQAMPANQSGSQANQMRIAPIIEQAPAFPNLDQRPQTVIAAKPTLPERQITPQRAIAPLKSITAKREPTQQTTMIRDPASSFKAADADQFRYSSQRDTRRDATSLMPIPSLNQTVTIDDPGGAFGNRESRAPKLSDRGPQSKWSSSSNSSKSVMNRDDSNYYPELAQQRPPVTQRRVTRLPLGLNSTAESKLTRLRDNTMQKISLSTTQFTDYTVKRGDSLQTIATKYFGKPDYYLDIYLANRDRLRYPGDLREGMSIKIPIINSKVFR